MLCPQKNMNKKIRTATKSSAKKTKGGSSSSAAATRQRRGDGGRTRTIEERLRQVVGTVDVAHALTMPLIRSIENILYLASRALGSSDASVIVRDSETGGLRFLVAIGAVADKLMRVRIPPGKGIAGFVFASGQPMAVADVHQESAFYAEVDRMTGYSTHTMLATPLQVDGETIGVLEFVNRSGRVPNEPFSPNEMDWAARFADAVAALVDAHESAGLVEMLFRRAVEAATGGARNARRKGAKAKADGGRGDDARSLQQWLRKVRAAPEHLDLVSLAVSLQEIASRGDAERRLCRDILDGLARWTNESRLPSRGVSYFQ